MDLLGGLISRASARLSGHLGHQTDAGDEVERHPQPVDGGPHPDLQEAGAGDEGERGEEEEGEADDGAADPEDGEAVGAGVEEPPGEGSHDGVDPAVNNEQQAGLEILDFTAE